MDDSNRQFRELVDNFEGPIPDIRDEYRGSWIEEMDPSKSTISRVFKELKRTVRSVLPRQKESDDTVDDTGIGDSGEVNYEALARLKEKIFRTNSRLEDEEEDFFRVRTAR